VQPDRNVVQLSAEGDSPPPSGASADAPAKGGKGGKRRSKDDKPIDFGRYNELLEHFVLIYGTDTVYDRRKRMLFKINALRLAFGNDYVKMWLNSDRRRMVLPDQLVFDPADRADEGTINLYSGLEMTPKPGHPDPILELLEHLCGESAATEEGVGAVVNWVLDWLAWPLQHPGAKMATALVFHGPQGAGKNLFFEAIAAIYGRYSIVVGQDQLEDKFNDWASQRLFVIGDEVVARAELFHQKNKLKAFITGETIQINTKMMPLRTERNHVNVVFLSNEHQPLALEADDRRYLVVYTPPRRDDDLYDRVATFLRTGGAAVLLHYLLKRDLSGFSPHARPLMTKAKADLIELGLKPSERFCKEWISGYLNLPFKVCSTEQLYRAFKRWCHLQGERWPPSQVTFSKGIERYARSQIRYKVVQLLLEDRGKKMARMWIPAGVEPSPGESLGRWAAEQSASFESALASFMDAHRDTP